MAFGAVKILDINGLSYLYTKLLNNINDFQNTSKDLIETAAAAANNAAYRANAISDNIGDTYATKEELTNAINGITSFEYQIVTSLPDKGVKGTIYLVEHSSGNQSTSDNIYDEYVWIANKYEKIGTTDIDLSKYLTADQVSNTYLKKTDASTMYATVGALKTTDSKVDTNTKNISAHTSSAHARADATKVEKSDTNGNIKINGAETTVYTHPSGTNPHGTTKSDVGLGNVGNFKAVSTVASQGLSDTEKANARANIGAGDGNYNNLSNKPTIGNGTITINQNGVQKAQFTLNQTGNTTVSLSDTDSTYDLNTMINGLGAGEVAPTDTDYYITQYAGGGTTNTQYVRRRTSSLYNYIKAKTDTLYAATGHTHSYLPLSGGTITGHVLAKGTKMALTSGKVTNIETGTTGLFSDGIAISNPGTFNDVGFIRVTGTGESDTVLEIATGDDGGAGEAIAVRQYNTGNTASHEAWLLDHSGNTSFPGTVKIGGGCTLKYDSTNKCVNFVF